MIHGLGDYIDELQSKRLVEYLQLLITNLIRFIGNDLPILSPLPCKEYPAVYCVNQNIDDGAAVSSYLDTTEVAAINLHPVTPMTALQNLMTM